MRISTETTINILKRIKDYCESHDNCEECPFLSFNEKTPVGMSQLNSFCKFGFEALHPLLPYQWPIEDWLQSTEDSEEEDLEEDDTILPW